MLKVYCQDCGSPTNYSNTKPKFCSSCGKPFDKNIAVNRIELRKPTITKRVLKEEDYDDMSDEMDDWDVTMADGLDDDDYVDYEEEDEDYEEEDEDEDYEEEDED